MFRPENRPGGFRCSNVCSNFAVSADEIVARRLGIREPRTRGVCVAVSVSLLRFFEPRNQLTLKIIPRRTSPSGFRNFTVFGENVTVYGFTSDRTSGNRVDPRAFLRRCYQARKIHRGNHASQLASDLCASANRYYITITRQKPNRAGEEGKRSDAAHCLIQRIQWRFAADTAG